ncbi:MAG: hypothetical protein HUK25_06775, partial [Treponema sp.]|nr:hypothetical protein [Treponema sp.]
INTTELADGTLTVTVKATDRAGNVKTETKTYTVNQESDKPVIDFSSNTKVDTALDTHAKVEAATNTSGKNIFGLNSNNMLSGSVTDDDGVGKITVQAFKADETTAVSNAVVYTKTGSFNCNIKDALGITEAGNYVIKVNAEDDTEKTGLTNANKADQVLLYIVVDGVAPAVSNIKVDGKAADGEAYIKGNTTVTFDVTENHLKTVKVGGTAQTLPTPTTENGNKKYSFTYTLTPEAANKNKSFALAIYADDKSDYSTENEINIFYDTSSPVINKLELNKQITTYKTDGSVDKANNVNQTITIKGTVGDNDAVDKTEVKILKVSDGSEIQNVLTAQSGNTASNFTYTVDTATKLTDKTEYKLYVKTYDRAGNTAEQNVQFYVNQETDIPSISFNNASLESDAVNVFGTAGWKINGIAEDDDGEVTLYHTSKAAANKITVSANGAFEYTITDQTSGTKSVKFIAVDNHGVEKEVTLNFVVDKESPKFGTVTFYNKKDATDYETEGKTYSEDMFVKKDHKIEFGVSDDNEVTKVEVAEGNGSYADKTSTVLSGSGKDKTVSYALSKTDETYTLKFRITDKYSYATEKTVKYKVDTVEPTVPSAAATITPQANSSGWYKNSMLTISVGEISDTNLTGDVNAVVTGASAQTESIGMSVTSGTPKKANFSNTRSFTDGESSVTYTFSDEAGNTSQKTVSGIKVDTVSPAISKTSGSEYITLSSGSEGVTSNVKITAKLTA